MKKYKAWLTCMPEIVVEIEAETRGKAKSMVVRMANDAGLDVKFTEARVKRA